jgi:hypothetical protein
MFTALVILIILFIYYLISRFTYKMLLKSTKLIFVIISLIYLIGTYFYFFSISEIHQFVRTKGIYIELGHADIKLLFLFVVCILYALFNIIYAIYVRRKVVE